MDQPEPGELNTSSPAEPLPWQAGDSGDPPTLVRGMRAIIGPDLDVYFEEMPGYGEK